MAKTSGNLRVPALAWIVRGAIGLIAIAVAGALFAALVATRAESPRTEAGEAARLVRVVRATLVDAPRSWEAYGTLRAITASEVAAEVAAAVVARPARIEAGAWVEAGELLARLDDTEFADRAARASQTIEALRAELQGLNVETEALQESLALATEAVELTKRELQRLEQATAEAGAMPVERDRLERVLTRVERERLTLWQALALIPTRRSNLEARIGAEQASLRLAELDVARCRVTAPITGMLQSVNVNRGDRVNPGTVVARVVDPRRLEVPVRLPVSAAAHVRIGDLAELRRSEGAAAEEPGRVARIAPEADPQTRTLLVFVEVEQEAPRDRPPALLPGQFIAARVVSSEVAREIVVPRTAVIGDRVMVVNGGGRVEPRRVTVEYHLEARFPSVDPRETQWAVIGSGLSAGEIVAVSNLDELTPGMPVRTAEPRAPGAPAFASDGRGAGPGAGGP